MHMPHVGCIVSALINLFGGKYGITFKSAHA
jgi:hypothetical protein